MPASSAVTIARGGSARVGDVDARGEAGAPAAERALEHVAEELVHLAAHALEAGEEVALGASRSRTS